MTTYRISQLAERSGVPASTLRFYETAGLLPAERTASGYRVYGEDAVQRLAFITSAKMLDLALEEIRDLLDVRELGVCTAVRERMLPLVAERIGDADRRQAELAAFSARLSAVREGLSGSAPAGACGPECGCTTTPVAGAGPVPVTLSPARPVTQDEAWRQAPVACTLTAGQFGERAGQWQVLLARASGREEIPDGLRLTFPPGPELAGEIAALAAAEQTCCSFFDFALQLTPTSLVLQVRAPQDAASMLTELFGVPA